MFDLYVVTDSELSKGRSDAEIARMAYEGGADVVQLRMKHADGGEMLSQAIAIREIAEDMCRIFIVNDRVDIAMASGADGVHLGQSDIPVDVARRLMGPDAFIGCSVTSVQEAVKAVEDGADYVGVGSIFTTSTKPDAAQGLGLSPIYEIKQAVDVPVVAIGGINRGNIQDVIRAGADAAAVVSAVVAQDDVRAAAHELRDMILKVRPHIRSDDINFRFVQIPSIPPNPLYYSECVRPCMGSQDEYLRNFTVLLTERGVVPLTDPMQISVYNCLQTGTKRPSDIAAELGVPSSSLHFVLDKMVETGVVVRSKPDPEKKSVYYSNLAVKVAGSFTPDEASKRIADETFRDPSRYYDGLSAVANMLESYTCEIGLDLDQVRSKYASAFADACSGSIPEGSLEDCMPAIRDEFARVTGFKFSVYGLSPLALVFEGDRAMATKMDMLSRFVARAVENATGKHYEAVSIEDYSSGEAARYKVSFDRAEPREEPYLNMSLPKKESSRFMMVDLDGSAGLMTSDVQLDMIDAIYERPLCITDIVNCVNAPRSTITSNLLRMVEEGVITVFYSESGSAYYGLSCSILMKKVRDPTDDDMGDMLAEVAAKDEAFMEGYLLYTIGYFKALGFDTDYLMVVLGAKYMRAAGYGQPKNFDLFFGKMSDIARAIGLSMNVVSVYPLTIGISAEDPESGISTAMTFVKGMAHQGLEMASDGIFVRNMEGDDENSKISFKEIYPALSMTPVEGIRVENLAPAPATKKRTSSVKTALFNRSEKATGKPARTVRYITGFAVLAIVAAVLAFSMGGDSGSVADTFSVDIEDADCGLVFYDSLGNEIEAPSEVEVNSVLLFSVEDGADIGYVSDGLAYRLLPGNGGVFSIVVASDLKLESLSEVEAPGSATVQIYNFAEQISDKRAYSYRGYYSAEDYAAATGGLWVGSNAVMLVTADDGMYISTSGEKADSVLWKTMLVRDPSMEGLELKEMPAGYVTLSFNGDYSIDGNYVTGELDVVKGKTLNVTFGSAHATGTKIIVTYDTGSSKEIDVKEDGNTFRLFYCFKDMTIDYKLGDFSRTYHKPSEVPNVLPILREDLRGRESPLLPVLRAGPQLRRRPDLQAEARAQDRGRIGNRRHSDPGMPPGVLHRR